MAAAVIFDMDGVLVDSYHAHLASWQALAREQGLTLTEEQFARTFGQTSRDIIRGLWGETDEAAVDALDRRKEALYREIVARDFPAMDGAVELIDALVARGVRLAVGSSGPRANVDLVLERLGRREQFAATVHGLEVRNGKPDPEVFLLAAARLEVEPRHCVVIEDAAHGIEAARAAGMRAVALISTGRSEDELRSARPDLLVHGLRDLRVDDVIELTENA